MSAKAESHVTRRDVARVLFRHCRKMVVFFFSVVALTVLAVALYPRSYTSEAKLFIRVGRESVALDPTATTGETILLQKTQVDEINSALELLAGRAIFQGIVDRVGAERIVSDDPATDDEVGADSAESAVSPVKEAIKSGRAAVATFAQQFGLSDPGTLNDRAIRWLEGRVKVWAPKESPVITISCSAASPSLAHDIVEATANTFVDEHVRINQTHGSLEFFAGQVNDLFQQLTTAEAALRDKKNSFQLTKSSVRDSIIEKAKDGMRQKVYDLQLAENDLESRYTDEYPPLKEIRRQREEAEAMLAQLPVAAAAPALPKSDPHADVRASVVQAIAVSDTSAATTNTGALSTARVDSELQVLNDQDLQLSQLQRKVELLDTKYRIHVQKLEQARVNDALGQAGIANVNIAQPAAHISKPVAPKKAIILTLGLLTAGCGAVGLAFCAESFDQTLRTTDQVRSQLGVPVLASLPYRRRDRDPVKAVVKANAKSNVSGASLVGYLSEYYSLVRELIDHNEQANGNGNGCGNGLQRKTIGIIGCETSALRSCVAGDLAIQAAQMGNGPVLLIDADAKQRNVADRFNINGGAGWCEMLSGTAEANECIHRQDVENLAVMGPGKANGIMPAARSAQAPFDGLKSEFDLVVVDLPPEVESLAVPADSRWLDEVVLVVEAERTHIQSAQRAKEALSRAGIQVSGVVLTNRREYIPRWLYQRL